MNNQILHAKVNSRDAFKRYKTLVCIHAWGNETKNGEVGGERMGMVGCLDSDIYKSCKSENLAGSLTANRTLWQTSWSLKKMANLTSRKYMNHRAAESFSNNIMQFYECSSFGAPTLHNP